MQTRLSICRKKRRFPDQASAAAMRALIVLHPYRCDRCFQYHLTSRTKGKRRLRAHVPDRAKAPPSPDR